MRQACQQPICTILPPHMMKRLSDARSAAVRGSAFDSVRLSERLRGARLLMADALRAVPRGGLQRSIYDAHGTERLPGVLVRGEGSRRSRDAHVNDAYDGLGDTFRFYQEALARTSIDGRGLGLDASVHYGHKYMNAFWDGHQMVFGDGDGEVFGAFTSHVDVIGHELTHGVISYEAAFDYEDQPGALNESFADVFGSLVMQYALKQTARQASWRIGEGLLVKFPRQSIRSLAAPGTAYDNDLLGKDPQPAHFRDFRPQDYPDDNGGVHVFSGIPNHAFYLAAMKLGGHAWEKAGRVWYLALTDLLSRRATFADAALATVTGADRLFGAAAGRAVRQAWSEVGVEASATVARIGGSRPRRKVA
jgi:Zn-dependent metalloprotease